MINNSNAASTSFSPSGGAEMLISYDIAVTIDGSLSHISHINPAGLAVISNGDTRCSRIAEHSGYHEC